MCGRFSLAATSDEIAQHFELETVPDLSPHYNIAPSQTVATVVVLKDKSHRQFQQMRWGLIPSWAKDSKIGNRLINARVETVTEKPSFRNSIRRKRCLIIADGYYEWQKQPGGKQPYYFQLRGQPFAFAGLWDTWKTSDGEIVSCTLLTTDASEQVSPVHHRMPIIVPPRTYSQWLDPTLTNPDEVLPLLESDIYQGLTSHPVSFKVNSPINDSPECIRSISNLRNNTQT